MKRVLALLALVCVGGAVAMGVDRASEVPIHYSSQPPLALQQQAEAEQPRFAQAQAEAEGDDVVLEHEVDHVERVPHVPARGDNYVSFGAQPPVKVPEHEDSFAKDVAAQSAAMDKEEREELDRVDTVMEESTNTMTQSARCLMMCANSYGLCTRRNSKGCACAAGCMCNRGEADATCAEHCHPDNQMSFVYGYHDADHFSPHLWSKTIGDTMSDYGQVRACLDGCAKRGVCKARFCPRHPSGGYKCSACKRLSVVPTKRRPKRYFTVPRPSRSGARRPVRVERVVVHEHDAVDEWGHLVRHTHTHHFPRFAQVHTSAEAEAETHAESGMQFEMEEGSNTEQQQKVAADVMLQTDAQLEAQAQLEAETGYVHVRHTPFATAITHNPSNIEPVAYQGPRPQVIKGHTSMDFANNGRVTAHMPQDPAAQKIDCNFYDCTGLQSEPYQPVGSLNPVEPYVNRPETRTTTFGTVPDMLEPRAEVKVVYLN